MGLAGCYRACSRCGQFAYGLAAPGYFSELQKQKAGKERYWVILSIIFMNIFLLAALSLNIAGEGLARETTVVRTLIGLSFIYLVTTSLFRIYPQALLVSSTKKKKKALPLKIRCLLIK